MNARRWRIWAVLGLLSTVTAQQACTLNFDWDECNSEREGADAQCAAFLGVDRATCTSDNICRSNTVIVSENIEQDVTWARENIYVLDDVIFVENDATVTIEAGTTILGNDGSAFIITRGSKLRAQGEADLPIVFSSSRPVGERRSGDWGGVALLGRAPTNEVEPVLEGVLDEGRAMFGGGEREYSCGVLEYVRIEFAGFPLERDEELNGLTLGGCGSGTILDHIQVHKGDDDGVEIFGGNVDLKHVVITGADDDSLDWDRGWVGTIQFLVIQQDENGDHGIEADSWKDDEVSFPISAPYIANMTLVAARDAGAPKSILMREGTAGVIVNSIFLGHNVYAVDIDDQVTVDNITAGTLRIEHSMFFDIGPNGNNYFPTPEAEDLGMGTDNDAGFDEDTHFRDPVFENVFGIDPVLRDP
ncbi:MAG: hypothetical protein AAGI01_17605, partial [Myxococcota bacterium]